MIVLEKLSYGEADVSWKEANPVEMISFIGLLLYIEIVELLRLHLYWDTTNLLLGLFPRKIISRKYFYSLLGMLHVSGPDTEIHRSRSKLDKVLWLLEHTNECSANFFQLHQAPCVNKRMMKPEGGLVFINTLRRQEDQMWLWGFKLWLLEGPGMGYTVQFVIYTEKKKNCSANGLDYDIVTRLCNSYRDHGYCIYKDNFYTSISLLQQLLECMVLACGTTRKVPLISKSAERQTEKGVPGEVTCIGSAITMYPTFSGKTNMPCNGPDCAHR